jgi:hypothetical protein
MPELHRFGAEASIANMLRLQNGEFSLLDRSFLVISSKGEYSERNPRSPIDGRPDLRHA